MSADDLDDGDGGPATEAVPIRRVSNTPRAARRPTLPGDPAPKRRLTADSLPRNGQGNGQGNGQATRGGEHRPDDVGPRSSRYRQAHARKQAAAAGADRQEVKRWIPIGAAGALLLGVITFGLLSSNGSSAATSSVAATGSQASLGAVTASTIAEAQPIVTVATSAPVSKTTLTRTISPGMAGTDVKNIQDRLIELGFDPGPADGSYGHLTVSAIWAFKKLVMNEPRENVNDKITPEVWDEMQQPIQVAPRRPNASSTHVEIYLPQQVMVLFKENKPRLIAHISSGELDDQGKPLAYCEDVTVNEKDGQPLEEPVKGTACGLAKTPGGIFKINRMVEGKRVSTLGGMYDPVYFNYGIAIHGAINIPLHPASHGCIRIERHISDYFQSLVSKGDQVYVWNGVKEPEQISKKESLPSFDRFTPDSTVPGVTVTIPPDTEPPASSTTSTTVTPTVTTAVPTQTGSTTSSSTSTTIAKPTTSTVKQTTSTSSAASTAAPSTSSTSSTSTSVVSTAPGTGAPADNLGG